MSARKNVDGPQVFNRPGLCLVHLVSLMQLNKPDRPYRPSEQARLADFFSILEPALFMKVRSESVQTRSETDARRREAVRHTHAVCRRAERRDCL